MMKHIKCEKPNGYTPSIEDELLKDLVMTTAVSQLPLKLECCECKSVSKSALLDMEKSCEAKSTCIKTRVPV